MGRATNLIQRSGTALHVMKLTVDGAERSDDHLAFDTLHKHLTHSRPDCILCDGMLISQASPSHASFPHEPFETLANEL